ncbi:hypothetical protein BC938DRAFT_470988 [Jimgerdemannia flammicorona]|uniref:Mitochondrial carrier domain-containing protein n=1 Tax=Jimgerdemannia flammicorona TaxID=994334 RepID=A0A433QV27_9FUNG|nr:hypothetical protein BC938DRAFT_470988 [Jimgerdemannia flammicorona]
MDVHGQHHVRPIQTPSYLVLTTEVGAHYNPLDRLCQPHPCSHILISDSHRLGTLHNTRMLLQQYNGPDRPLSIFQHGLAGLAGGLTVSFLATPVEQIKARLQVQYADGKKLYTGPIHCAKTLIHNNGFFRGLWKGLVPTMLFRSWFFVFWSSYEVRTTVVYGRELRKRGYSDSAVSFIAGGVCANTFWLGGFPFGELGLLGLRTRNVGIYT